MAAESQQSRTRADIAYLDGAEAEGRRTATLGFNRAANYLSGQMRAAGLQPVLSGEYRMQYAALLSRTLRARIRLLGRDTTEVRQGVGYLITSTPSSTNASGRLPSLPEMEWLLWADEFGTERGTFGRWEMEVTTEKQASTAPMHVMGMLPGAHPAGKDSLVIVLAPIDGSGLQGTDSWTDGSDLAIPPAALLSGMRQMATNQQTWSIYPQTTLFALLSGTRDACQGPQQFLKHLTWDRSMVSSVTIISMQTDAHCDWQALLRASGLEAPIEILHAYAPFDAPSETGFGSWRPRSETQRPDALDVATTEALRLAREVVERMP